ncbi:MAG: HU family DNA-binding protein [Bacteroidales bacterium]|nr:HU family DNA-binding protein [Bacteroidales bacterium]
MNNKEFIQELSKRLDISTTEAQDNVQKLIKVMTNQLEGENAAITVQNFGVFEVKKKLERISVNPVTQQRMLIPPKLSLSFRPSPKMKELFK